MVEHLLCKQGVKSSNLLFSTGLQELAVSMGRPLFFVFSVTLASVLALCEKFKSTMP